ncbi:MAG: MarC family protein [Dehalococcoidales bacterium]|nr:MarC family protein [Dehalococcoidales bacterium]
MPQNWLNDFILTFIPLLIVIDALGNTPVVVSMSEGLSERDRRKLVNTAVLTGGIVGFVFLFFGQFILKLMNISVGAFAIAGGIILLVLSVKFMTTGRTVEVIREAMVAVAPIGTPLTVGPATITTLLLLATQYPVPVVAVSFTLNLVIVWVVFLTGNQIITVLGQGGLRAISRVFSLLLAAIAVNMIFRGLTFVGILNLGP